MTDINHVPLLPEPPLRMPAARNASRVGLAACFA